MVRLEESLWHRLLTALCCSCTPKWKKKKYQPFYVTALAEQREERQLLSCFAIPLFKVYFTDLESCTLIKPTTPNKCNNLVLNRACSHKTLAAPRDSSRPGSPNTYEQDAALEHSCK